MIRAQFPNLVIGTLLLVSAVGAPLLAAADEWKLEKYDDGIEVHTRSVEGSGIKEFKGIAIVNAELDWILKLLSDADGYKTWFPNCIDSKALAPKENASYRYSVSSTPWPISDRDMILEMVTNRDEHTGTVTMTVTAAPDNFPVQEDLVRVRKAIGSWKLEPIGLAKTRVTFSMHLEPGGGIPKWLVNARVVGTPLATLGNLRAALRPSETPRK